MLLMSCGTIRPWRSSRDTSIGMAEPTTETSSSGCRRWTMPVLAQDEAWHWVAVIVTAGIFAWAHSQYDHWPTTALIGALGIILALARIRTGGILVPMVLHGSAEIIGLTTDWLLGQWYG